MSARSEQPTAALRIVLVALAYAATARWGLAGATVGDSITPIWAPAGIALAAVVVWGRSMWIAVALGALLAYAGTAVPPPAVAAIGAANTLEALLAAWLLGLVGFRPGLPRMRDIVALAVLAGVASTLLSATIGVASLSLAGVLAGDEAARAWLTWWLGHLGGDLLVAPLLLLLASRPRLLGDARRRLEAVALGLGALLAGVAAFSHRAGLVFLVFPFLVWAAVRFRQLGAAAASLLVAAVAVLLTVRGAGPFHVGWSEQAVLVAQLFAGVAGASALVLAAITDERERAIAGLRVARDELEAKVRERTAALTRTHARIAKEHELAPVGSWEWDLATGGVTWSEELHTMFGLARHDYEPSYEGFVARLHDDDRERVVATIEHCLQTGQPFTIEYRIVAPGGSERTLAGGGQMLTDGAGRPVRMLGIAQDVTEQQRADHAIRESRERARLIVDASSHAFVSIDAAGAVTDWNTAAEQLLGHRREEVLGRSLADAVVPERQRAAHRAGLERFARTGASKLIGRSVEMQALHRSGRLVPVELTIWAIETRDGPSFHAFLQDISERTRARRRLATENAVGRALLESGSLAEARPRVLAEIGRGLGWAYGAWWSLDGSAQTLRRMATWYAPELEAAELDPWSAAAALTPGEGLPGRAWQLGEPIVLAGAAAAHLYGGSATGRPGFGHAVGLPIVSRNEVVAVVELAGLEAPRAGDDMAAMMRSLAERIAGFVERDRFEGQLQHLADHDPLTDLFNHRRFRLELSRELTAARRYGTSGALLALDIDNLKSVNDTLGHDAGNDLIAQVAAQLRQRLRETDIIGRIGGDEFAAVLPYTDAPQALRIATQLLDAVRDHVVVQTARGSSRTTASAGIAVFDHADRQTSGEELMVQADMAMYDAKGAGRDRVHFYDPRSGRQPRRGGAEQIRSALAGDRFTLHAQPIVALAGPGRRRYELLVRMIGPEGGLIAPAMFMATAERLDLVQELDRWVLRRAIVLLSERERAGYDDCFDINLSARSIVDPKLPALIKRELDATGLDPGRLVFEVTETAAITDIDRARRFARALAELGCGLALDDFGTGFASFYNLKHLPFDELKIDGEFVENLPSSPVNQLVVRSIVSIATGLRKHTVAECVGDDATIELLRGYGVDYVQGYHVGRPRPLEEVNRDRPPSRESLTAGLVSGRPWRE